MKKMNLERITNTKLFESFEGNELKALKTSNLKGGTSTVLCSTSENFLDPDSQASQESTTDSRCQTSEISEAP